MYVSQTSSVPIQSHHLPDPQQWAVEQERMRHDQAVYNLGEYAVFVLMWTIIDFDNGLVSRCPLCYLAFDKIAETYKQAAKTKCENCFGTTFESAYKAIIVRPSLWKETEEDQNDGNRGTTIVARSQVESTSDFLMNGGDIICRSDGIRWKVEESPDASRLHTGFELSQVNKQPPGMNYARVAREDDDSVVYLMPPTTSDVKSLNETGLHWPDPDRYAWIEDIRGPLL